MAIHMIGIKPDVKKIAGTAIHPGLQGVSSISWAGEFAISSHTLGAFLEDR
jgi:hypothetical protein